MSEQLPVIDLRAPRPVVAQAIADACRSVGFFYVVGHDVDEALVATLMKQSHQFFALSEDIKARFAMPLGGRAWRGWFPLGGELTSGRPDWKEGLYLGTELPETHPRVRAGVPMHGANLIPDDDLVPGFRSAILTYIDQVTRLGHQVMAAIAASLALPDDYFFRRYTSDPLILFRIFQYPSRPVPANLDVRYGVGEHTDYGLLTLLRQDDVGGLTVRTGDQLIDAPPIAGSFVCNIGDMLEKATGGVYRSTPHRVQNTSSRYRVSMPFFFDPGWDARVERLIEDTPTGVARWDGADPHLFDGTYADDELRDVLIRMSRFLMLAANFFFYWTFCYWNFYVEPTGDATWCSRSGRPAPASTAAQSSLSHQRCGGCVRSGSVSGSGIDARPLWATTCCAPRQSGQKEVKRSSTVPSARSGKTLAMMAEGASKSSPRPHFSQGTIS